jgi:phage terminase small subunit
MASNALPAAPKHLSDESRTLWCEIVQTFVLEGYQLRTLRLACEAYDLAQQARELLAKEGLTITDRYGVIKPHPAGHAVSRCAVNQPSLAKCHLALVGFCGVLPVEHGADWGPL